MLACLTEAGPDRYVSHVWPALLIGLYLVTIGGWPILLIGLVASSRSDVYGRPWPFGYHGLATWSASSVLVCWRCWHRVSARPEITPLDMWASIPVGCLVTAILIVIISETSTRQTNRQMTLAVYLGRRGTRLEYAAGVAIAYLVVLWLGLNEWWASVVLPCSVCRWAYAGALCRPDRGPALNQALKRTVNCTCCTARCSRRPVARLNPLRYQ